MKKKISVILVLVLLMQLLSVSVAAADNNYVVSGGERIYTPDTYVFNQVFNSLKRLDGTREYLKNPQDLFINKQGYMFIADTGNNRIVKMNTKGDLIDVYTGPKDKPFNSPSGIYADDEGNMYVADTKNNRIVHLDSKGVFVEEFVKPKSDLLGQNFTFEPTKLYVSPTGYIYLVGAENIITMDANNIFRGFLGKSDVEYSLIEVILRIFASKDQQLAMKKRLAVPYSNLFIGDDGRIYATTYDNAGGAIKRLNAIGENTYKKFGVKKSFKFNLLSIFSAKTTNLSFQFGEITVENGKELLPKFIDIASDKNGIVTVLEENTGKLYQYDRNGNALTVFGGKGELIDQFNSPTSIALAENGTFYVLDSAQSNIKSFKPTQFISQIHEATNYYENGDYDKADIAWNDVIDLNSSYQPAVMGIGNSFYKRGEWKKAMEYYKLAENPESYSKAYEEYRYEWFRKYFVWITLGGLALIIGLIWLVVKIRHISLKALQTLYSNQNKLSITKTCLVSLSTLFTPGETFYLVKRNRKRLNYFGAIIIYGLVLVTRIIYLYTIHYPLQEINVYDANIYLETVKILLPSLTWVVASYAISSILNGESQIGEIFTTTAFCMVPYIVINLPLSLLSNILSRSEIGLFGFINTASWIWVFALIIYSFKSLNTYRIGETCVKAALGGVTVLVIWIVGALVYVSSGRIMQFVTGIIREIQMTWL